MYEAEKLMISFTIWEMYDGRHEMTHSFDESTDMNSVIERAKQYTRDNKDPWTSFEVVVTGWEE